jgi:ankyrin repeat domain-containing protein 50
MRYALAYFYFTFSDTQKQTFSNMLRSIIGQLLDALLLQEAVLPLEIQRLHREYVRPKRSPDVDKLKATAHSMIKRFGRVFIVLDALDESESGRETQELHDRQYKRHLRKSLLTWVTEIPESGANILVTSREERDIKYAFDRDNISRISMQSREVDNDVRLYVGNYLQNTPGLRELPIDIKAEIKAKLVSGSQGM